MSTSLATKPQVDRVDAPVSPEPDADGPAIRDVMVLREVLAVLRISESVWYRAKRAGRVIVPEIAGLPGRYSGEQVRAAIRRAHVPTVRAFGGRRTQRSGR